MGGRTSGEPKFLPNLPIFLARQEPRPPKGVFRTHSVSVLRVLSRQ